MSWLLLTIISAITGAAARILQKVILKDEASDVVAYSILFQLLVGVMFFGYCLLFGLWELPNLISVWPNILVLMVFYGLGNIFIAKAFKLAEASEVAIILASGVAWSVLSALAFLGESINAVNVVGIMLVLAGVLAVNYSRSSWKINRGHLMALLGAITFGSAITNDAIILKHYQNTVAYMGLAFTLPGIFIIVLSPKSLKKVGHFLQPRIFKLFIVCSLLYSLAALCIFTAYKLGGQMTLIMPIHQTNVIFAVLFGYLFLMERAKINNKILGTALVLAGVMLLV